MKRSPAAAFWLSLIPGAGHVYVGQAVKGLVLILLVASAIHLVDRSSDGFVPVVLFLWIFGMLDAHRIARETNHRLDLGAALPSATNGFAPGKWWGWTLVAIGVVFTLDNLGLFDIDWLWNLWPLALIGAGVYILRQPETIAPELPPAAPPLPVDEATAAEEEPAESERAEEADEFPEHEPEPNPRSE